MTKNTFTKIPNFIFDLMKDMNLLDIKVLMFIIRKTGGYHRNNWETSISDIIREFNISKPSVYKSLKNLLNLGLISYEKTGKKINIFLLIYQIKM